MGWPLSQDYNEAVQNPRTVFADPDLKAGEVVPGPLGLPLPRSGNFADVYQIRGADGRMWALKCFTRPAVKLAERYRAIDAHLREARLPFTVGFQFLPEGVRVRGLWYPALKMEWVEGLPLNEFVRQNVGRPDHLKAILGLWVRLSKRLREAQIAHADLQHGNVLLVPGASANRLKLRLIDYDGMWVPALADNPSGEAGHPNFQHPARLRDRVYSADVDRFPHLVIGCALRALSVAGKPLWDRLDNGDNLLFREVDFADPARSKAFRTLWELDDPTVTNLVALLVLAARRPPGDTPWLDDVLSDERTVPVKDAVLSKAADALGVARRAARQSVPVAQIFVVPEEANQFTDFGGEWTRRRPARRGSRLPIVVAGGVAALAVGLVVAILVLRGGKKAEDPVPPPPVVENKGGPPAARFGSIETKWVNYPSAPQAPGVAGLVSGIDVAPPAAKAVRSYPVHGAAALGAWLLPDGSHAVLAGRTHFEVLDLGTGLTRPLPKPGGDLLHAAVSPDGRFAVAAAKDRSVRCFDLGTGAAVWTNKFPGAVTALAITPDGERVAASGEKVGYTEWALADGSEVRRHESLQASQLAFTPDGSRAIAVNDGGVELWSLDEGKATVVAAGFAASAVCVTADGEQALAAGFGKDVKAWGVADGKALPDKPSLLRQGVTAQAAVRDGTLLFGGPGGEYGYLGPDGTNVLHSFGPDSGPVVSFSTTGDGQHVLIASEKGSATLTRLADLVRPDGPSETGPTVGCLDFVRSVPLPADATRFAADARGERVLTATPTHVRIYSGDKFAPSPAFRVPGGAIVAAGFGPDDTIIVCQAEPDGSRTRAYDARGGNPGPVFAIPGVTGAESARITRFVSVVRRPWVIARTEIAGDVPFDPTTGKVVTGWPAPRPGDPTVAAASPGGKLIAFGTPINPVKLWDADTENADRPLEASAGVVGLAFTPDGNKLIGLWPHGRLRVWDTVDGKLLSEVGHDLTGPFTDLAAVANNVVALTTATGRILVNIDAGTALNTGDGPDPLAGRGIVVPARGWVLAADREERLTAWRVNPEAAARLKPKPPPRSPWPDVKVLRDAPASPPLGLAFAPDGKSVLFATEGGKLGRYTADRLRYAGEVEVDEAPLYGFARAGDQVLTLGRRSVLTARSVDTLEKQFDFLNKPVAGNVVPGLLAANPDASSILFMTDKLRLADLNLKREIEIATLPKQAVGKALTHFAFSTDGKTGVGRWANGILVVWHPKTGQPRVLDDPRTIVPAAPQGLAVTPDGKVAILATGDGKVAVWETATARVLYSKAVYEAAGAGEVGAAVAVLPAGDRFLTAGRDGRVLLWDLAALKVVQEYRGPDGVWRLAVAPDGKFVVMQRTGFVQRIDLTVRPEAKP